MKSHYKWMSASLTLALGALLASGLVACAKSSNNAGVSCPAGYAVAPDGATCAIVTVVPSGIPAGTKIGFFAQTSNMNQIYSSGGSSFNMGTGFTTILRDAMGVCDQATLTGGSNYGVAGCSAWQQGYADIIIQMDGSTANQVKMMIRASPYISPFANYSASVPSFTQAIGCLLGICTGTVNGYNNPLVMNMTIWNVNNSQGFELRSSTLGGPTGTYSWNRKFQFQVLNGKIEDPTLNFNLLVDNGNSAMVTAISGVMARCQTQNCGVIGL